MQVDLVMKSKVLRDAKLRCLLSVSSENDVRRRVGHKIGFVDHRRRIGRLLNVFGRADVIEVGMRMHDSLACEPELL